MYLITSHVDSIIIPCIGHWYYHLTSLAFPYFRCYTCTCVNTFICSLYIVCAEVIILLIRGILYTVVLHSTAQLTLFIHDLQHLRPCVGGQLTSTFLELTHSWRQSRNTVNWPTKSEGRTTCLCCLQAVTCQTADCPWASPLVRT